MPRVAQYQEQQTTQVVRGARASNVNPGAFGGQVAKGIVDLGQGVAQMQQRLDTTAAEEAAVQFERDKNDLFFNPDTGYFNSQGRDAYDNAGTANEALEALKDQYSKGLSSDNAKRMFGKVADAHITRGQVDIGRHSAKGLQAWEIATIEAQAENSMENAALYWSDDQAYNTQRILGRQAVMDAAKLKGIDGEALAERLQTFESAFAYTGIEAAASQSYGAAKDQFDDNKDRLEGPDLIKAKNLLEQKKKSEETQSIAAVSSAAAMRAVEQFDSLSDAMDHINKTVREPRANKAALSEVKQRFDLKNYAERVEQQDIYDSAEEEINAGSTGEAWIFENPDQFEKLSPKQQEAVRAGSLTVTDQTVWTDLKTMPLSELKSVNPNDYTHVLGANERKQLQTMVADARSGKFDVNVMTQAQEIKLATERLLGKEQKKWGKDDKEEALRFQSELEARIAQATDQKRDKLTQEEVRGIISDLSAKVVQEGFFTDTEVDLTDIPPGEFRAVREDLINRGLTNPSTETVIKWWLKATK
jgi:hypothetical protein